jgi:folate-dependent phosphoribosylglycinamide formyltransferase PurN
VTLSIGWFTTARGAGSRGMYEAVRGAIDDRSLDAQLAYVFCNREPGESAETDVFLDDVRARGDEVLTLSSVRHRRSVGGERSRPGAPLPQWREAFDAGVARLLEDRPIDIGVLAGYMLIFTAPFVETHPILNLHPALPTGPIGTWREVNRALIRTHAEESGVMVHLAIPEVDEGPVAAFCRFSLRGGTFDPLWQALGDPSALTDEELEASELFGKIRMTGVAYERPFLVAALGAFADGRVRAEGARLLDTAGRLIDAVEVTDDVERRLAVAGAEVEA